MFTVSWTVHMSTKTTEQTWRGQTPYVAGVWWVVWSLTWETYQALVPLVMSQVGRLASISSGRWRQLKSKLKGGKFVPQKRSLLRKKFALSLSLSHCLSLPLSSSLSQKHKMTLKPSPTRSRKQPTTPETNSRVGNFLILIVASSWLVVHSIIRLSLHNMSCCVRAGIERQLESNTDERASADLRIRKSQVRKFFFEAC